MSVMPGGGDRRRASQMPMSCPVGAVSSRALRPLRVKGHPFIGNTWQIFRRPWSFIQDAYRALGPAYRVTIKGNDAVVLAGPEVRELYSEAGDNFLNRAFFYGRLQQELQARELIFRTRGERHRMMRHCASLAFSRHISAAQYLRQPRKCCVSSRASSADSATTSSSLACHALIVAAGPVLGGCDMRPILRDAAE